MKQYINPNIIVSILSIYICSCGFFKSDKYSNDIYIENLSTHTKTKITHTGMNSSPVYLHKCNCILFHHIPSINDYPRLKILNIDKNTIIDFISDNKSRLTPSVDSSDSIVIYTSFNDKKRELWQYSIKSKTDRLLVKSIKQGLEASPYISHDGKFVLYINEDDNELYILDIIKNTSKRMTFSNNFIYYPQYPKWLPNSKEIVFLSFGFLRIVNLKGNIVYSFPLDGLAGFRNIIVDPHKSDLIYLKAQPASDTSYIYNLYEISINTNSIRMILSKRPYYELSYDFSPNGEYLVHD